MTDDTVAAISTAQGEAGIGIVRLSGPEALKIADRLFFSPKGKVPGKTGTHKVIYGFIKEPDGPGGIVDEVLLTVMRAPDTYTRQDVVEINCHGGMTPVRRVLELALKAGARLAQPGEFTKRAFLNGRIDLSQAEAVLDLIRAKTAKAERLALEQLRGGMSGEINAVKEKVLSVCVHFEALMDFPEEDVERLAESEIRGRLRSAMAGCEALSRSYEEGRFFRDGLKVVIAGRPNVGKSSLLNALIQKDRAIVTDMSGTTRDVIDEHLDINGLPMRVMDTAGIREARDLAEEEGVRRSLCAIEDADLVLCVFDGSVPFSDADMELIKKIDGKNSLFVINKSDLPQSPQTPLHAPSLSVSAKTGFGLEGLKAAIYGAVIKESGGDGVMVTNLRHKIALDAAHKGLEAALSALGKAPLEIAALELKEALGHLGEITGAVTTEDILDRIFGDFCIGK